MFRLESELNTVLFAGFSGLVSKLWLRHDERHVYVRALWWVLALVSEPGSIHYAVLPGLERNQVLADPALVDTVVAAPGGWWRPAKQVQAV